MVPYHCLSVEHCSLGFQWFISELRALRVICVGRSGVRARVMRVVKGVCVGFRVMRAWLRDSRGFRVMRVMVVRVSSGVWLARVRGEIMAQSQLM